MSLETLEKRINTLMSWKSQKERQQLTSPLDEKSRNILFEDAFLPTSNVLRNPIIFTDAMGRGLEIETGGKTYFMYASLPLTSFSADAGSNVFTSNGHYSPNGTAVVLAATGALPTGLNETTVYFMIDVTPDTFKLSTSEGGSEVDISDTGSTNYFAFI